MKQFSNLYIFCFSSALVLVVAAVLSFTALALEGKQKENIEIERQQKILAALGVTSTKADVLTQYDNYIKQSIVIRSNGTIIEGEAHDIDLRVENRKDVKERSLPLYRAEINGESLVIIPLRGAGLWGPMWGNVALEKDMSTIRGVSFDHAGETPGLGAEINTKDYQEKFQKKKIFDESNNFVSIKVEKPGTHNTPVNHRVDGISGGTITSKALEAMIHDSLEPYKTYFLQHKSN